jgi:hypothetical protein
VVEVDLGALEPVGEVRAARAGADGVVGPEHDVVGEELGATLEELGQRLLAVLGIELVLLLDRHPGKLQALLLDLLVALRVLLLELGELVAGGLPLLSGARRVSGRLLCFRHVASLLLALLLYLIPGWRSS